MDEEPVTTCDGERVLAQEARRSARLYFLLGFLALPWLWACSVWLYLPALRQPHGDPIVRKYVHRSAIWLGIYMTVFLAWFLMFQIGGPGLLGKRLYEKLDVRSIGPISFGASY
ncbi:PEN2 [Auxenochlorella protothecoides x Auxenochlorella symbiontica]